jgi:hypothetical protein
MTDHVSRRSALFVLGAALGLALGVTEDGAKAETARRPQRRQRRTGQPATAPAAPTPAAGPMWHENPNGTSAIEHQMQSQYRLY